MRTVGDEPLSTSSVRVKKGEREAEAEVEVEGESDKGSKEDGGDWIGIDAICMDKDSVGGSACV